MIFVIPIVMGVVAASTAVAGLAKGVESHNKFKEAEEIGKEAQKRHERAINDLETCHQDLKRITELYGQLSFRVRQRVIGRFVRFLERTNRKSSSSEWQFLEGMDGGVTVQDLQDFKALAFEAEEVLKIMAQAGSTGCAAGSGAVGVASAVGTVAVPQFFGLFAKQVAVSQLGLPGITLWLGGGNVLLGGFVLGGIALGPALAVAGFQLAGKGEEALTKARGYQANANAAIAKINSASEFVRMLEKQIREIGALVHKLEKLAIECLDELESKEFDVERDAAKYHQAYFLVKALAEILKVRVLDDQGNLDPAIIAVQAKYRNMGAL